MYSIQKRAQVKTNHSTKSGTRTTRKKSAKRFASPSLWQSCDTSALQTEVFIEIRGRLKAGFVLPDRGNKVSVPKPAAPLTDGRTKHSLAPAVSAAGVLPEVML